MDICIHKNELVTLPHTYINTNSKQVKDLRKGIKTIKLKGKKLQVNLITFRQAMFVRYDTKSISNNRQTGLDQN